MPIKWLSIVVFGALTQIALMLVHVGQRNHMLTDGLIEVQDTQVVKIAAKERKTEPRRPHQEIRGKAKLLRIYMLGW